MSVRLPAIDGRSPRHVSASASASLEPTRWRRRVDRVSVARYGFRETDGWDGHLDIAAPVPKYEISKDGYLTKHFQDKQVRRRLFLTGVINDMGQFNTEREQEQQLVRLAAEKEAGKQLRRSIAEMGEEAVEFTTPGTRLSGAVLFLHARNGGDGGDSRARKPNAGNNNNNSNNSSSGSATGARRTVSLFVTFDTVYAGRETRELGALLSSVESLSTARNVRLRFEMDSFVRQQWPEGNPPREGDGSDIVQPEESVFAMVMGNSPLSNIKEQLAFLLHHPCGYKNVTVYLFYTPPNKPTAPRSPRSPRNNGNNSGNNNNTNTSDIMGDQSKFTSADGDEWESDTEEWQNGRVHGTAGSNADEDLVISSKAHQKQKNSLYTTLAARSKVSPFRQFVESLERMGHTVRLYTDPSEITRAVLVGYRQFLDMRFPEDTAPSRHMLAKASESVLCEDRQHNYIYSPVHFAALDHMLSPVESGKVPTPFAVIGPRGSGKTALLANWTKMRDLRDGGWMLSYFVGSSSRSLLLSEMLRSIICSIKQRFKVPEPVPESSGDLVDQLADWILIALHRIQGIFMLVLDGIDNLEYDCASSIQDWLPMRLMTSTLAYNLRIVTSFSKSSAALHDFWERKKWSTLYLQKLDWRARTALLKIYFEKLAGRWGMSSDNLLKTIDSGKIIEDIHTGLPGYLTQLASELSSRDVAPHGLALEAAEILATAPTIESLLMLRMNAAVALYDSQGNREGIVDSLFAILVVARSSITLELLARVVNMETDLMVELLQYVSPLIMIIGDSAAIVDPLVRTVAAQRFLADGNSESIRHILINLYVPSGDVVHIPLYAAPEIIYQLASVNDLTRLREALLNLDVLESMWRDDVDRGELYGYMMLAYNHSEEQIAEAYANLANNSPVMDEGSPTRYSPERIAVFLTMIVEMFTEMFPNAGFDCVPLLRRCLDILQIIFGRSSPRVLNPLGCLARELMKFPDCLEEADEIISFMLEISDGLLARRVSFTKAVPSEEYLVHTAKTLAPRAGLFLEEGNWARAIAYSERAIQLMDQAHGSTSIDIVIEPSLSFLTQALMLQNSQRANERALAVISRLRSLLSAHYGDHHPRTASVMLELARLHRRNNRRDLAVALGRKAYLIRVICFGPESIEADEIRHFLGGKISNTVSISVGDAADRAARTKAVRMPVYHSNNGAVPKYLAHQQILEQRMREAGILEESGPEYSLAKELEREKKRQKHAQALRAKIERYRLEQEEKEKQQELQDEAAGEDAGGAGSPGKKTRKPHPPSSSSAQPFNENEGGYKTLDNDSASPRAGKGGKSRGRPHALVREETRALAQDALKAAQDAQKAAALAEEAQRKHDKEISRRNRLAERSRHRRDGHSTEASEDGSSAGAARSTGPPVGQRASPRVQIVETPPGTATPSVTSEPAGAGEKAGNVGLLRLAQQTKRGRRDSLAPGGMVYAKSRPTTSGSGQSGYDGGSRPQSQATSIASDAHHGSGQNQQSSGMAPQGATTQSYGVLPATTDSSRAASGGAGGGAGGADSGGAAESASAAGGGDGNEDVFKKMENSNAELKAKMALLLDSGKNYVHFAVEIDLFMKNEHLETMSTLWLTSPKPIQARVLNPGKRKIMHASLDCTLEPNDEPEQVDIRDDGNNVEVSCEVPPKKWDRVRFRLSMILGLEVQVLGQWTRSRKKMVELYRIADVDEWGTGARFQIPSADPSSDQRHPTDFGFGWITVFFYPDFKMTKSGAPVDIFKDIQGGVEYEFIRDSVALHEDVHGWNRLVVKPSIEQAQARAAADRGNSNAPETIG